MCIIPFSFPLLCFILDFFQDFKNIVLIPHQIQGTNFFQPARSSKRRCHRSFVTFNNVNALERGEGRFSPQVQREQVRAFRDGAGVVRIYLLAALQGTFDVNRPSTSGASPETIFPFVSNDL